MVDLATKKCVPCEAGVPPLTKEEAEKLLNQLNSSPDAKGSGKHWKLSGDAKHISKEYTFKDFMGAMTFANKITAIAEEEGHHPDLLIGWGRAGVELTTHAIKGLSENDFILAAKIDKIHQ